jgi:large subunit ribosomal protein L15
MNQIQRNTESKSGKRIGRGGKRGKTSGRGHKGQRQHGGHGVRPEIRDRIKKLPKLRGYGVNRAKSVNGSRVLPIPVNVAVLERLFAQGDTVSPSTLAAKGVFTERQIVKHTIKVLGHGDIAKKLDVVGCVYSTTAKEKIEKAGGSCA